MVSSGGISADRKTRSGHLKEMTFANGSKISVVYEGEQYMLKFPPHPSKNEKMS